MIAVLSDLHFEEEASDIIAGPKGKELRFRRNFNPLVFASFVSHMADEVRRRKSKEFHLVIAGDLFDLNRTTLWFSDDLRPYVPNGKFSPALEQKVLRILDATARRLHLPGERFISTIAEHGNTSAASVPLALAVAVADGRIKRGDLVLMEAMGGGLTWGAGLVRW